MSGVHDFDFLHGRWRVEHRRLRERLTGGEEWVTLQGTVDVRPVLGGMGNIDSCLFDDGAFEGMTVRLFDSETRRWGIHWADSVDDGRTWETNWTMQFTRM